MRDRSTLKSRFAVWSVLLVLPACSSTDPVCHTGSDCASGVCSPDGTCAPGTLDGSQILDALKPDWRRDRPPKLDAMCVPNDDGIVTREEMPFPTGIKIPLLVATDVTVNTEGVPSSIPGRLQWDLTGINGKLFAAENTDPKKLWFAKYFPEATVATHQSNVPMATGVASDLLSLTQVAEDAALLLGFVSPKDEYYNTELILEPPAAALKFPFKEGDTFTTDAKVSGHVTITLPVDWWWLGLWAGTSWRFPTISDLPSCSLPVKLHAEVKVDGRGFLKCHYHSRIPVYRVTVANSLYLDLDLLGLGLPLTQWKVMGLTRKVIFVAECLNAVATISSKLGETNPHFTTAAEVERLPDVTKDGGI
jgi:hypothetical protein